MDSPTIISIVVSVAALLLSIVGILNSEHTAYAGRKVCTERARREVALLLQDLVTRNDKMLAALRRHSQGEYGNLAHLQNRLKDASAYQQKFSKLESKFEKINATGRARRWYKLELLQSEMLLLAKPFEQIEDDAKKIAEEIVATEAANATSEVS